MQNEVIAIAINPQKYLIYKFIRVREKNTKRKHISKSSTMNFFLKKKTDISSKTYHVESIFSEEMIGNFLEMVDDYPQNI